MSNSRQRSSKGATMGRGLNPAKTRKQLMIIFVFLIQPMSTMQIKPARGISKLPETGQTLCY